MKEIKPIKQALPRLRHRWFDNFRNGFDAIRERDVLLYPYYTFEHTLELLPASFDPNVLSIKINIYRVAKDSRIIDSVIHAAHNGKKSRWSLRLQARFDEAANIHWAKRLTEAGVHVTLPHQGLKSMRNCLLSAYGRRPNRSLRSYWYG